MATVFIIRHAEPELTGVLLGQLDPGLSAAGVLQAAQLGDLPVAVAWASPLRRARETAERLRCPVIELAELRELDQGEWNGKSWTEIETKWPEHAARKMADWLNVAAPGGEEWPVFIDRVSHAWNRIRTGPAPMAVVAHQAVNAALLYLLGGHNPLEHSQTYGEVIEYEFE